MNPITQSPNISNNEESKSHLIVQHPKTRILSSNLKLLNSNKNQQISSRKDFDLNRRKAYETAKTLNRPKINRSGNLFTMSSDED